MFYLHEPKSKEHREIVRLFTGIGRLKGDEIRLGLEAYVRDRSAISRAQDAGFFKVYALNRFIFDVPADAPVHAYYFMGVKRELWPWARDGSTLILQDKYRDVIGNAPRFDPLKDFDWLRARYGFRKGFGGKVKG